jgi:hypothetical protein
MTKKHRSPSYPAVDLGAAIKLVEKLYPAAKHSLGAEVIAEQLGYKGINSASPYIAALKHFGLLMEESGNGDRMLRLSDRALDIAVDREGISDQRKRAIKEAALDPALHAELWDKWGRELPPDGEMRRYLERERGFNPNYVGKFIEQFKATLSFSGLSGDDKITQEQDDEQWRREQNVETTKDNLDRGEKLKNPPSQKRDEGWSGPIVKFDLPRGNMVEIRLRSKLSPQEFAKLKKIFELSELAFVADDEDDDEPRER